MFLVALSLAVSLPAAAQEAREPAPEVVPLRVWGRDLDPERREGLEQAIAKFFAEYPELLARPFPRSSTEDLLADMDPSCVPPSGAPTTECLGRLAGRLGADRVFLVSIQRSRADYQVRAIEVDRQGREIAKREAKGPTLTLASLVRSVLDGLYADRTRLQPDLGRVVIRSDRRLNNAWIRRKDPPSEPTTLPLPSVLDLPEGRYEVAGIVVDVQEGTRRLVSVQEVPEPLSPEPPMPVIHGPGQLPLWRKVGPWVLVGLGGAALGVGIGMHVWALEAKDEGENYYWPRPGLALQDRIQSYNAAWSDFRLRAGLTWACYGTAAALVGGGLAWYFLQSDSPEASSLSFAASADGAVVTFGGRF